MNIYRTLRHWVPLFLLTSFVVACVDKEQGQCAAPNDSVTWHWIKEKGPFGWTSYKCILCDESLASDDGETTGCFYSYPASGWEDPAQCKADICSDDPSINDPVHPDHGAWKHINDELVEGYPVVEDELLPAEDEITGALR